jgi:hypothetical protein
MNENEISRRLMALVELKRPEYPRLTAHYFIKLIVPEVSKMLKESAAEERRRRPTVQE